MTSVITFEVSMKSVGRKRSFELDFEAETMLLAPAVIDLFKEKVKDFLKVF
jgi:hypothetical protein